MPARNPLSVPFRKTWIVAILVLAATFALYGVSAVLTTHTTSSKIAFFDSLAGAFLQGHLFLAVPPVRHDLTLFDGHWYVPFPPLPALLLLPWVAAVGVGGVNTVLFSIWLGAVNVTSMFLILQCLEKNRWTQLGVEDNLWLTALFGFGSVQWYMSVQGSVWYTSQICTITFVLIAALITITKGSPIMSGLALGLAMLGRPNVVLTYPLLLAIAAQLSSDREGRLDPRYLLRWILLSGIPITTAVVGLLAYNAARFGNFLDFGYATAKVAKRLAADLKSHGLFNLYYVPRNFTAMWLQLPVWDQARQRFVPTTWGLSLLITTPALLYLMTARRRSVIVVGAWLSVALLLIPLITYYNTGWTQFGYRFSLDFMLPVMVLLAVGVKTRVPPLMRGLIVVGIVVNAWGVAWFGNPNF